MPWQWIQMELGWSQMTTEAEAGPIFKVLSHLVTAPVSLLPRLHQQASCGSGPQRDRTGSRMECSPGSGSHLHVMRVVTSSATCLLFSLRSMVTWPGSRLLHMLLATGQNGESPGSWEGDARLLWPWNNMLLLCSCHTDTVIALPCGSGNKAEGWKQLMKEGVLPGSLPSKWWHSQRDRNNIPKMVLPISRRLQGALGNGGLGDWLGEGPGRGKERQAKGRGEDKSVGWAIPLTQGGLFYKSWHSSQTWSKSNFTWDGGI